MIDELSFLDDHYELPEAFRYIAYGSAEINADVNFVSGWEAEHCREFPVSELYKHQLYAIDVLRKVAYAGKLHVRGTQKASDSEIDLDRYIFERFSFDPTIATSIDPDAQLAGGLALREGKGYYDNGIGDIYQIRFIKDEIHELRERVAKELKRRIYNQTWINDLPTLGNSNKKDGKAKKSAGRPSIRDDWFPLVKKYVDGLENEQDEPSPTNIEMANSIIQELVQGGYHQKRLPKAKTIADEIGRQKKTR
ncbi:hypothetical protein GQF03_17505 [Sneathiella chungangensis]|uniref:Uncharacterized protein n=1 Tax=Sneathiella chungangensis TaxID=1418234 RepID=A0A845MQG8_9PROT|nr:hypothetical protein [Sneathiella chungangensis]MZR24134.1 hypothetical protein [Sneathiella chungangensis]